jgi:hypothetical protein
MDLYHTDSLHTPHSTGPSAGPAQPHSAPASGKATRHLSLPFWIQLRQCESAIPTGERHTPHPSREHNPVQLLSKRQHPPKKTKLNAIDRERNSLLPGGGGQNAELTWGRIKEPNSERGDGARSQPPGVGAW